MDTPIHIQKAIEAAGVFLSEYEAHSMEYTRLLKLLYICDRNSVREIGDPVIGPKWVAMRNGPLHSSIYDLIKHQTIHAKKWQRFFDTRDRSIYRCEDPGVSALSRGDVRIIREVGEKYRRLDTWEMVQETHQFQEWADAFGRMEDKGSSAIIRPEAVFEAVGMGDAFESYSSQITHVQHIDSLSMPL